MTKYLILELTYEYPLSHSEEQQFVLIVLSLDLWGVSAMLVSIRYLYLELWDSRQDQHTDGSQ